MVEDGPAACADELTGPLTLGERLRVTFGGSWKRPAMYARRVKSNGGRAWLHLRVHEDGTGALFVNVDQVILLTPVGADMARLLFSGVPSQRVARMVARRYPRVARYQLDADLKTVQKTISTALEPGKAGERPAAGLPEASAFLQRARAPYKADLALAYSCNNDCAHCYNEPERKTMASLETRNWQRVLRKLWQIGVPHIIFTGGEPTLAENLPALIRFADQQGQVTGVNTNGRRLADAGYAETLAGAGLDHIQVTLASHIEQVHNDVVRAQAWDETVEGIRNCLRAGLHTITNTTLTRTTAEHALDVVQFVRELGITTFAMNGMICSGAGYCNPTELDEAELVPILQAVRERAEELGMRFLWYTPTEYCRLDPVALGLGPKFCNAAEYSICIEPNGDVLPCQSYYEPCGNILRDDWGDIWNCSTFAQIRTRREKPRVSSLPERCWSCEQLSLCAGGCFLRRTTRHDKATNSSPAGGLC